MATGVGIGERSVGPGHPCLIIAEAGVNHDGDLGTARGLVDAAVAAGADAVKFQSFKAENLATAGAPKAAYQLEGTDPSESQRDMLRRLELGESQHRDLAAYCRERGILFLSSPFDEDSADMLARLNVPAFKIPSGELSNPGLLEHVARLHKPIILSTGMATLDEVKLAVNTLCEAGAKALVLLHCVSNYPAHATDANLRAMATMAEVFDIPVGFSDHTLGTEVSFAAVALGACVIEKHLTLGRGRAGPDHAASLEPDEFASLVQGIRTVESALGHGRKEPAATEASIAAVARRSLVAAMEIPTGTRLTDEMIVVRRPGTGVSPTLRASVVGRTARRGISAGAVITFDMLS